jgi:hypothetical protein
MKEQQEKKPFKETWREMSKGQRRAQRFMLGVICTIVLIFSITLFDSPEPDPIPKSDRVVYLETFSGWDGSHEKTVDMLKSNMKYPNSLKVTRTFNNNSTKEGYTIKTMFSSKNDFGMRVKGTCYTYVDKKGKVLKYEY